MSLTTLIKGAEARARLDAVLPKRFAKLDVPCQVPPRTGSAGSAGLVGTAFDYAARIELARLCPHACEESWVAETAIARLRLMGAPRSDLRPITTSVRAARDFAHSYGENAAPQCADRLELAMHALRLARVDLLYRAPLAANKPLEQPTPEQASEVAELLGHAPLEQLAHPTCVVLNPTFGKWSAAAGGADADLISGSRLIDFKTQSAPNINRHDVRQVLAYFLLGRLASESGVALPAIEAIEIYFARYCAFFAIPTDQVVSSPAFPSTAQWFRDLLEERMRTRAVVRATPTRSGSRRSGTR